MDVLLKIERKILNKLRTKYLQKNQDKITYFQTTIVREEVSDYLKKQILLSKPLMITRFGSTEFVALEYLYSLKLQYYKQLTFFITGFIDRIRKNINYEQILISNLCNSSGFFPNDRKYLTDFFELMMHDVKDIDILGVWLKENLFKNELKSKQLVSLESLEPYYSLNPWTEALAGKKVLVIHPFAKTIESQYQKRELLFKDKRVLPAFELQTIKAIQTVVNTKCDFENWFDALNHMKTQISQHDFDIAIIGCGAYGLPLAAHIKRMGKISIHLGGATQILFGIKGKRWESIPMVATLINEHWVKPLPEETPSKFFNIEDGAYW